ncbi:MAG: DUF4193 family protein [Actinobacteria bacterium]|nr:DUF4193 family protein [Actinomycetota bacterium]MSY39024.1 DUF4193 family protein [Actinomycetota bacterium]MSZ41777.1 DUF4193 family protein [Actinomycetota bacterium]
MSNHQASPRMGDEDQAQQELQALKLVHAQNNDAAIAARLEIAENLELPGADHHDDGLALDILPKQLDEFTCSKCFLVHHRSQLDHEGVHGPVCTDCS